MSVEHRAQRQAAQPPSIFGRGPMAALGMPVQKAKDFKGTVRRLAGYLAPHRAALLVVIVAGVIATVLSVVAPKILGLATTRIFEGYLARARRVPGARIDFAYVAQILVELLVLYVISAMFQYVQQYLMAGVAQKTVYAIRKDVEAKFERLPLEFYDSRTHGEILSRAVNDMDSIGGTLQQNLTQLITSVLTIIGVIVMMLTISVVLTLIVFLSLPLSMVLVRAIARRSRQYFMQQQKALGQLNGHVAEMYAGHSIITAYGHEQRSIATFNGFNEAYYDAAWRAQFSSGLIFPVMMFVGNLGYVFVSVIGGFLVTRGSMTIGDVQAFIQ
jgi:ATP-binding cassette subfamily B multidrug efflux pump